MVKSALVWLLFSLSFAPSASTIIIAGDNWCPINCVEGSEKEGFMIDIATEALALSNHKVNYIEIPWTRAVGMARKGEIHAVVGAFRGDAPDFVFPQRPLLKISPSSLFATSDNWQYTGLPSMNKVILGTVKGYDYGSELNMYINSLVATDSDKIVQLYGNNAVERNIQFLLKNRIDVFVESEPVFWYQVNRLKVKQKVQKVGEVSPAEPCFIAFSPNRDKSPMLAEQLDQGLQQLLVNGRIEHIANKYGLPKSSYQIGKTSK